MATTFAPTRSPIDEGAIDDMNDVTAQFLASTFPQDATASSMNSRSTPHINLPPPPNPPFTFPARPASLAPSSLAPSSLSRTAGRRHQSAIDIPKIGLDVEYTDSRAPSDAFVGFCFNPAFSLSSESNRRSKPSLPDFSFNPAKTPPRDQSLLSPSFTPPSPRTNPSHIGHRRGGSEFVGGKLNSGERITVMSISPIKSEAGFAPPTLTPPVGPQQHQRGHSHRRSSAISSHDLSLILQGLPDNSLKGSKAPTGPAPHGQRTPCSAKNETMVETTSTDIRETATRKEKEHIFAEKPRKSSPKLSPKPVPRARVGFSDTLEFIPRPLSLISTDTASTVCPGHSVSGSVSSVLSVATSMNPDRDSGSILVSPVSHTRSSSRPSTAGAVLERTSSLQVAAESSPPPKRRNSIPILNDMAQLAPPTSAGTTPSKTPKRWSFFGLDSFTTNGSPTEPEFAGSSSSEITKRSFVASTIKDVKGQDLGTSEGASLLKEKKSKSDKKRKKKVKSWADSILTRKTKLRTQNPKVRRRSETPPAHRYTENEDMDCNWSGNNQPSGMYFEDNLIPPVLPSSGATKSRRTQVEDEMPYPMIDLDAALGPFNTPTRDPQWDEAQRPGVQPKRQLHSAAKMRGFSGPGMHYHRRTESAPEMPPFEEARFNMRRFSTVAMADVFEEDEEDDDEGDQTGESIAEDSTSESQGTTTSDEFEGRDAVDVASTPTQEYAELVNLQADVPMPLPDKGSESASSLDFSASGKSQNEISSQCHHNEVNSEEQTSFFPAWRDPMLPSSEHSDADAASHRRDSEQMESVPPDATPIILSGTLTMPISPYSATHSSSFPSPHSPISYDAHQISTAASSIADENNYRSLLMGEPGPDLVRLSFEVPSLASTNSTTTRENNSIPGVVPRNMPFYEQRPASFTSPAFGRRRSSLVSLSRLISSAHGERSKLSMEVSCETEVGKKSKPSKSKRLTKLMQFWKPKASGDPR